MIVLTSTTDSPEQMAQVLEARGMEVEKPEPAAPATESAPVVEKPAEAVPVVAEPAAAETKPETAPALGTGEEDGEVDGVEVEGTEGRPERKRKSGWQRKIDKLTSEADRLRGEKDALERQLVAVTAALPGKPAEQPLAEKQAEPPKPEQPKIELPKRPKREDFSFDEEKFQVAMDAYEDARDKQLERLTDLNQQISSLQSQLDERATAAVERSTAVEKSKAAWEAQVSEAKTRYADLDEVLQGKQAEQLKVSFATQQVLGKSKIPVDVYYYLGKHPEEATALYEATETDSLPKGMKEAERAQYFLEATVSAATEVARIENLIRAQKPEATKKEPEKAEVKSAAAAPVAGSPPQRPETKVSAAPPPTRPLAGDTAAATTKDPSKMSATEWRLFKESAEGKSWRARHNV